MRAFKFILTFVLAYFVLDGFLFRFLLWRLPNESAWESFPLYNFEYRFRHLARREKAGEFRIIAAGSSIALYSILPEKLNELFAGEPGNRTNVLMLARQGLNVFELNAIFDRILETRPDVIILPLNMVDFRLERPIVLDLVKDLDTDHRGEALQSAESDLWQFPESQILDPGGYLLAARSPRDLGRGLFLEISAAYRYRSLFWDGPSQYLENRYSKGRSYENYAGIPVEGGNITHRGWVGSNFEITITETLRREGLDVQAPDSLFARPGENDMSGPILEIQPAEARPRRIELQRGWQNISLSEQSPGSKVRFRVSRSFYSDENDDRFALRFSRNAGRSEPISFPVSRELRREDERYRRMTDTEYPESFARRILKFSRPGMQYLQSLQTAKRIWALRHFDPDLPAARAFRQFQKKAADAGIPLVVIHSPENPLSREWYEKSVWYAEFIKYLSESPGAAAGQYSFYQWQDALPMQDFYDYHHLTYFGAQKFTDRLARILEKEFHAESAVKRRGGQ